MAQSAAFHPINSSESPYNLIFPLWPPHCLLTVVDTTHNSHRSPSGGQHPWLRRQPHCDRLPGRRRCFSSRHRSADFSLAGFQPGGGLAHRDCLCRPGEPLEDLVRRRKTASGRNRYEIARLRPAYADSQRGRKPHLEAGRQDVGRHRPTRPAAARNGVDHRFSRPQYERAAFPRAGRHGRFR